MGIIGNAIRDVGMAAADIGQGFGLGIAAGGYAISGNRETGRKMAEDAMSKLSAGSKIMPILSECRDIGEGISRGDYKKVALNAGILALTAMPAKDSTKVSSYFTGR